MRLNDRRHAAGLAAAAFAVAGLVGFTVVFAADGPSGQAAARGAQGGAAQKAAPCPPAPAEFVLRGIAEPVKTKEGKDAPGSAAERLARQKKLGASYTSGFDLSGLPEYVPAQKVSGTIRVWGNNYIDASGLGNAWTAEFQKFHPGVKFEMVLPTAAVATAALYMGVADLAMTHQPTFYDSLTFLRILGFEPTGFMAVTGSFDQSGWMNSMAIAVHKDNPIEKVTLQDLDGVFGAVRVGGWEGTTWRTDYARGPERNIRTWDGLGLKGEWAGKRIHPYGYSVTYSTAQAFSRMVLQSSDRWNEDMLDFGNIRNPDGSQTLQATQIVDHLKADRYGIAFIRYQKEFAKAGLKFLPVAKDAGSPAVAFTIENIQNRSYPLAEEMNFWVSVKPGSRMDPRVKEFLRFVLSRQGQTLVQDVDRKYLPLSADVVKKERARLDKF